jgi:hypothetical protein
MAAGKRLTSGGILVVAFMVLVFAPAAGATTTTAAAGQKFAFPSATPTSIVAGNVGFIDDCQIGYFWSAANGDSVSQTVHSYEKIQHAVLDVSVIENGLTVGNQVDSTLSVNDTDVGSFVVTSGFVGVVHLDVTFGKIKGPTYTVKIRVTNDVPFSGGSITFAHSSCGTHQIILRKR